MMMTEKFKKNEEMIATMFETLKNTVLAEFESAPWATKKPDFISKLKSVTITRFHARSSNFSTVALSANRLFDKCISVIPQSAKRIRFCASRYIDWLLRQDVWNDDFGYVLSKYYYGFNAGYNPDMNRITFYPVYYIYNYEEFPLMVGTLLQTMGHELSHVFFHGNYPGDGVAFNYPLNSPCFQDQLFETCELFFQKEGNCRIYKTKMTFNEDAADWVAWKAAIATLKTSKYYSKEAMKQLFYANAIDFCKKPEFDATYAHSTNIIRTNGINRMLYDFQMAFQCKKGDRMVQEKKCQPFTGEESPEYRKKAHIYPW